MMEVLSMEIGVKIKERRTLLMLTQQELADRCELTKGYISQLENDKVSPSIVCQLEFQVIGPLDSTQSFVILFSSPTRDWIWALALWVLSPNHWTTREFPNALFFSSETFPNHLFKIAETFHPKFYPSIFSIALSIIYFILYLLFFLSFFPLHSDYQLYEGCDLSVYFFHFCVPRTCHRAQYIVVSQQ